MPGANKYKNLLIVCKTSRLDRFQKKGFLDKPYIQRVYKAQLQETHNQHHGVIDEFVATATRMGKKVTIRSDDELRPTDILGTDLVISMGGDHTFLHASALIWDKRIPILGINTYPTMFQGALNMHSIEHKERKEMSEKILTVMEDDLDVQFEKRSRILFERIRQNDQQEERKILCLNEAFCAEKDVSSASRYRIVRDGADLGVFKSSGLIVSTGTGSTGWLYAARQITAQQLADIQATLGTLSHADDTVNEGLAREISDETVFDRGADKMYFCVREGFSMTRAGEGFCQKMVVTSEMLNGEAIVDGWFQTDLSIGDSFSLESNPKFALRAMHLEL